MTQLELGERPQAHLNNEVEDRAARLSRELRERREKFLAPTSEYQLFEAWFAWYGQETNMTKEAAWLGWQELIFGLPNTTFVDW